MTICSVKLQTCLMRNKQQQTTNETSTQMTSTGIYVSEEEDRLIMPRPYVTADDYHAMILENVN